VQLDPEVNVLAKIECAKALDCIDEIIQAADAVMVVPGDLGVEIGMAGVPSAQKKYSISA
jgi:pyruvate kinase